MPPDLFALVIFQVGLCCFCWDRPWAVNLLLTAFHISGASGIHHHTQLIYWDGVSLTFA
jgi:hypothetical protein